MISPRHVVTATVTDFLCDMKPVISISNPKYFWRKRNKCVFTLSNQAT